MAYDPFEDARQRSDRAEDSYAFDLAKIVAAPDGANHQVVVKVVTEVSEGNVELGGTPMPAFVTAATNGDVAVPEEGDFVVIGYLRGRRPVVIGAAYTEFNRAPDYSTGQRTIGNESGSITVEDDGTTVVDANGTTVEVKPNGDVVIDGGSTQPVTDVETTTDADGHVTSISISRADGVYVPSN